MKRSLADALDDEATRRLGNFFDVLSKWDDGLPAISSRPPRSLASPDAPSPLPAGRRRGPSQKEPSP